MGRCFFFVVCPWSLCETETTKKDDDNEYCNDDELIEWYEGYQKRKNQKAKIKQELMPIVWHPDRVMDCRMSEDQKKLWK